MKLLKVHLLGKPRGDTAIQDHKKKIKNTKQKDGKRLRASNSSLNNNV